MLLPVPRVDRRHSREQRVELGVDLGHLGRLDVGGGREGRFGHAGRAGDNLVVA